MKFKILLLTFILSCLLLTPQISAQTIDSTQIGKEYPYHMPFLGKQAYKKGYAIQKPFGAMIGSIFNKQGIILDNFEMAIGEEGETDLPYKSLDGILDFGPSEGRVTTINGRIDAWILPFLSVGGYAGKVWGEQTISFSLLGGNLIESTTEIRGRYYGFNLLGVVPLGFANLAADYSWSWTTNENLDKPVMVEVAGLRLIKRIPTSKKDQFWAVWGGMQFQKLDTETAGNIAFDEALGISDEDKQLIDDTWESFMNNEIQNGDGMYWDELNPLEKQIHTATYNLISGVVDSTVYYKFNKKLEYNYNMLLGFNYQHNSDWQFRAEYGFLKSKQQLMLAVNYRFGFKKKGM